MDYKEVLENQIKKLEKKTAPEELIPEQYVGKCEHCGYDNDFKLSVGTHLPDGVYPKFCMKCGKEIQYFKMA